MTDTPQTKPRRPGPVRPKTRVIVVGAGLAGLSAAYNLHLADVDVVVVEARPRVGGRVSTVALSDGNYCESGGEFVSPGHARFLHYAGIFNIGLEDSKFYEHPGSMLFGQRAMTQAQAQKALADVDRVFDTIAGDADAVDPEAPWRAQQAAAWDRLSLSDWLQTQVLEPHSRALVQGYWEGGNGVAMASQSYLGAVAQAGANRHPINTSRCVGGASRLPQALATAIGDARILLGDPVVQVDYQNSARVTTQTGKIYQADWVILAIPPGPWGNIQFNPSIEHDMRAQMGSAVKYVLELAAPPTPSWRGFSDAYINATWQGAGQVLVCFAGGPAAQQCSALPSAGRDALLEDRAQKMLGCPLRSQSRQFFDWTVDPFTQGGYSVPAPGQLTRIGERWQQAHHRLWFAGEHTSSAFFGFMEGALRSGEAAAAGLLGAR